MTSTRNGGGIRIIFGLNYSWTDGRRDFLAGLTVAAISLPQGMAYALIAAVDPRYGLYSAMVVTAAVSIFGSSSHLINGPTSAISLLVFRSDRSGQWIGGRGNDDNRSRRDGSNPVSLFGNRDLRGFDRHAATLRPVQLHRHSGGAYWPGHARLGYDQFRDSPYADLLRQQFGGHTVAH
jgi:hypothetical protein